jgi:hypothetical protein
MFYGIERSELSEMRRSRWEANVFLSEGISMKRSVNMSKASRVAAELERINSL